MYNEYMKYGLEFFIIIFPVCIAISYLLMWLWTKENKEEVKDFILFGGFNHLLNIFLEF